MPSQITKNQLLKFVEIRNKSAFNSNLQFACDATTCGFDVKELETCLNDEQGISTWKTPHGILTETNGRLSLNEK